MKVWELLAALLGSAGFFTFLQYLINRRDNRKDLYKKIQKQLEKQEKDICRMQLLLLISDYPHETKEILTIAEHYFKKLHGNWYLTTLFRSYLQTNGIAPPIWFADAMKGAEEE